MQRIRHELRKPPAEPRKSQRQRRAAAEREYKKTERYLSDNPLCACGCGRPAQQRDHICRGPNRAASLTNTDTINGLHSECHDGKAGNCSVEEKIAMKVRHICRRVEEYIGRKVDRKKIRRLIG